jgi:hypothetical protein
MDKPRLMIGLYRLYWPMFNGAYHNPLGEILSTNQFFEWTTQGFERCSCGKNVVQRWGS